jgi:hypothetical protein
MTVSTTTLILAVAKATTTVGHLTSYPHDERLTTEQRRLGRAYNVAVFDNKGDEAAYALIDLANTLADDKSLFGDDTESTIRSLRGGATALLDGLGRK